MEIIVSLLTVFLVINSIFIYYTIHDTHKLKDYNRKNKDKLKALRDTLDRVCDRVSYIEKKESIEKVAKYLKAKNHSHYRDNVYFMHEDNTLIKEVKLSEITNLLKTCESICCKKGKK